MSELTREQIRRKAAIKKRVQQKAQAFQSQNESDQGYLGDSVDAFQHGFISGGADLADGVRYLTGSETAGNIADSWRGSAEEQINQMSPEGRKAMQSFGINTDDGLGFNEGSSLGGFGLNVISGLGSFAPTMIPGGLAARGLSTVGKVAGATGKAGKIADKAADVVGFGGVGALAIGGGTANQAYETVAKADLSTLAESEVFKQRYWEMRDYQEMGHEQALTEARESIAKEIAEEAAKDGAALGAISQGALGPVFGRLFRGEVGGYAKSIAAGAATEGAQELVESGGQTAIANKNVNPAIPTDTMDGVVGDALTGAMTGAAVGGGFGLSGKATRDALNRNKPEPEDTLPGEQDETTARADELQSEIDQLDDQIQNNSDDLSDAEYSALLQRREALLREQLGESIEFGQNAELEPLPDMAGPRPEQVLGLPNQKIIYGQKPEPTQEQINRRERTRQAYESQHGTARNTGLEGEYLGNSLPGQSDQTNQRIGLTLDGEYSPEAKRLGNEGVTAIEDQGIIFGEDPVSQSRQARSNGLTDAYQGPQRSRKADDPERLKAKQFQEAQQRLQDQARRQPLGLQPPENGPQPPRFDTIYGEYQPSEQQQAARETTRQSFEEPVSNQKRAPIEPSSGEPILTDSINSAAAETNTNPTEAQIEADNYKKGRVKLHDLDIAIENPKGSVRSGKDSDGKEWSLEMAHHYGDIKGVKGADGDDLDVFIGEAPDSQKVFIVNQVDPKTGAFDEHKVMLGFNSKEEAEKGYLANYEDGWSGLGAIEEATTDGLKSWMKYGNTKQPYSSVKLAASGKPFATEKSARLSRTFSNTPNAEVVPVEGGYGVRESNGESSPTFNPSQYRNYGWDRVKLSKNYTGDQLKQWIDALKADPDNLNESGGIYIYDKKTNKKLDALSWAITYQIQQGLESDTKTQAEEEAETQAKIEAETATKKDSLSNIIDSYSDETLTDDDAIPKSYTGPAYAFFNDVRSRMNDGDKVTIEEIRDGFERLASDPEKSKAELNKLNKKQLMGFVTHAYSDTKKAKLVDMAFTSSVKDYRFIGNTKGVITSRSYDESGIIKESREHLANLTQEQVDDYVRFRRDQIAERTAQIEERRQRIDNPETLEDYRDAIRAKGRDGLTDQQLSEYDRLVAEKDMADKPEVKAGLEQEEKVELGEPEESTHGKTGETIFNVKVITKLGKDKFKEAAAFARSMGGGYYRSNFYLKTREDAEVFSGWVNGEDVDLTQSKQEAKAEKKAKSADKLKAMAERLEQQATETLNADRKENTFKRMNEADSARKRANQDIKTAATMKAIADNDQSVLKGLTQKTQIELLQKLVRSLEYHAPAELKHTTANGNRIFKDDVTPETKVKFAEMPLVDARPMLIEDAAKVMAKTKGYVLAGKSLVNKASKVQNQDKVSMNQRELDALRKFIESHPDDFKHKSIGDMVADLKRLERMGIKNRNSLRAALLEFMQIENNPSNASTEQSKLGRMERDLQRTVVGNRNAFNDFFPTPAETASEIIDLANIQPGMKVLEPSAGNGLLADAAKEAGAKVDAVEMAGQLREILGEKGYKLVGDDFLEYSGGIGEYDRIVMNPPFSSDQDIQHVAHAYDKLKPGGRLVAIVSSMAGERQNKRNQAFNKWLDDLGAETQPLPENAFKSSLNPTAVRTKAIIIDKPEDGSVNVPDEVKPPKEALMSLNQGEASGMNADDVRAAVEPLVNDLHERGTFEVVQSINDLPFAIRLQAKAKLKRSKGENPVLRGINAGDKNYLIADGLRSEKEAVEIFLHEVVGHKAVLDMLGKDGDNIMEQIAVSYGRKGLADLIKTYGVEPNTKEGRILLGKEKVAHMAERGEKPALLKRLVAKVKAWLRNYFPSIKWSDNDVLSLISNARDNVENRYMTKVDLDASTEKDTQEDSVNLSIRGDTNPKDVNDIIGRTQAKPTHQKGMLERAKEFAKKVSDTDMTAIKQGVIDSYASIEALEKKVNLGKLMDGAESAYKAALRTANLDSVVEVAMRRGALEFKDGAFQIKEGTKGLLEIFQKIADSDQLQLWETWAGAKRAKRIMEEDARANLEGQAALKEHRATINQLKKTTPAKYPGGLTQWRKDMRVAENGMKEARTRAFQKRERLYKPSDIQRVIKYVNDNTELKTEFEKAQKEWRKFNKSMLDMAEQAGLIDPEARAIWEHDDYVPFHRVAEIEEEGGISQYVTKRGLSGQKSGIEQLKGGVEKLNIIESMVRSTTHMIDASFKNVAMQRIVDTADGIAMEKVPATKMEPEEANAWLQELGYDPESMEPDTLSAWHNQLERYNNVGKGTVSVARNGKLDKYHVTDPLLYHSITQLGPVKQDLLMKILQVPKRTLTTLVTADPGFMVANFMRDTLSTWVTVEPKTTPLYDAIKGAAKAIKRDESLWQIMAAGGGGGGYYDTSPDNVRQHLSSLQKGGALHMPKRMWDAWMRVGQAGENANRIAVFDSVIRDGGTVAEGAHEAQDVINFSKRGGWRAMQYLISAVPFMNARIQGLDRLWRGAQANPKAFFLKGSMLMGASLALLASNWDNEEYWELPEWDRDANWHLFIGGEHFKIPKPFEVGAFFGTIPERAFEQMRSDANGKLLAERMLAMLGNTFAMDPTPQLFKPALDVARNTNGFTGNPILGFGDQFRSPEGQYSPWTSESMKQLAETLPDSAPDWMRSPKRLEYLFKGYFGTLGGYILGVSDSMTQMAVDAPERPELTLGKVPVVKRFYSDELTGNKHVGRFYDMADKVNALYADVKTKYEDGQKEEANKIMKEEGDKLRLRSHLNKVRQQISEISSQIRMVHMERNMSAEEKRRRIDELSKRRNQIARMASLRFYDQF